MNKSKVYVGFKMNMHGYCTVLKITKILSDNYVSECITEISEDCNLVISGKQAEHYQNAIITQQLETILFHMYFCVLLND